MPDSILDYKKYLDPSVVGKLNSLELKARLVVEGFLVGLQRVDSSYNDSPDDIKFETDISMNLDWVRSKRWESLCNLVDLYTHMMANVLRYGLVQTN